MSFEPRLSLNTELSFQLETFNLDVPHSNADELSDGIAMSRVLYQM